VVALLVGIVVSVPLFSNQVLFVGLVPRLVPGVGDVTFLVGIALSAAVYALLFRRHAACGTGGSPRRVSR
jgi:nucleobase:cation symporter-1, NCS1 family